MRAILWPFWLVMVVFWALSAFWWWQWGYEDTFLWFNQFQWGPLEHASRYLLTHLGDGIILPALLVLMFWRKAPGLVLAGILAVLLTGILAQFGKQVLFEEWHRPPAVFEANPVVRIVFPDAPRAHSFPSGHATSMATGGVFFTALLAPRWKMVGFVTGLFTVLLCFTRVVLGVHFPGDIFVGSIIGTVGGTICLLWLAPYLESKTGALPERYRQGLWSWFPWVALIAIGFQFVQMLIRVW